MGAAVAIFLVFAIFFGVVWMVASAATGTPTIRILGDGEYEFDIVGEASYQDNLKAIAGQSDESAEFECEAIMQPEPYNQFDSKAIKITIQGLTVGYIARTGTKEFHRVLGGRTAAVDALIVGGWDRGGDDWGHFGVRLDIERPISVAKIQN